MTPTAPNLSPDPARELDAPVLGAPDLDDLVARFDAAQAAVAQDPFGNPHLLFALRATEALAAGALSLDTIARAVQAMAAQAFDARAQRMRAYLDDPDPAEDRSRLRAMFEALADRGFDAYAAAVARAPIGMVLTAHPTFALDVELSEALVELATEHDAQGVALDDAGRAARHKLARDRPHGPPPAISMDLEHAWSIRALDHALGALDVARELALDVGRARWPDRWTVLSPRLMTLATWVGFDQDGRDDVTWTVSFGKRLDLKRLALERRHAQLEGCGAPAAQARLDRAAAIVRRQIADLAAAGTEPAAIAAFARSLVADRDAALADPAPLIADLEAAAEAAADPVVRGRLSSLLAGIAAQGICLAHVHVRLNSAQLHNAVRREVNLETSPADPANRRSYFQAINALIDGATPQPVNFQSLLAEPTTAKSLFIAIAQMAKFIDAATPVRFLIAETESGFTLLTALYYARLFGVEHLVEISPLFETEEALHRGEAVIEEALRSPHYRAYLRAHGRVALQFGFSDSGRFIGQTAATFRIERLRLRLAELFEREGLHDLEVVLFNTHGDSIGRGGHPDSLGDRLAYAAPAQNRAAFRSRGLRVREEDSFQGGDGYLPLFTPTAALATVRGALAFGYAPELVDEGGPEAEAAADPIYAAHAFAAEFFATVQQGFTELGADPDYPALLGLFSTRLLPRTGSRPEKRAPTGGGRVSTLSRVSELRAIPNNAILQGLGQLANTTHGVARAAAKDPAGYADMRARSPRFARAMAMAETAHALGDLQATRAYAATVNPSLWLDRRRGGAPEGTALALVALAESAGLTARLSHVLRRLRAEPAFPPFARRPELEARRARVRLVHAIRIALIQEAALIATRIPPFAPRIDVTRESLQLQILRLDLARAAEDLTRLFPAQEPPSETLDFGEPATYVAQPRHGYGQETERLIRPLLAIRTLLLQTTALLNHDLGACG